MAGPAFWLGPQTGEPLIDLGWERSWGVGAWPRRGYLKEKHDTVSPVTSTEPFD